MGYYRDTICLPEYHTPMEFHQGQNVTHLYQGQTPALNSVTVS